MLFRSPKADGKHTLSVAYTTFVKALQLPLNWASILIVLSTVAIKRLWPTVKGKLGIRIHIPASILAIIVMTSIAQLFSLDIRRIGELPRSLSFTSDFSMVDISISHFAYAAIVIAMLGAIESLLSARVADGIAKSSKHEPNKELFGQGLATIASA